MVSRSDIDVRARGTGSFSESLKNSTILLWLLRSFHFFTGNKLAETLVDLAQDLIKFGSGQLASKPTSSDLLGHDVEAVAKGLDLAQEYWCNIAILWTRL